MADANQELMTSHDFSDHKGTYEGFLRIASIGLVWVLGIVASLAIGGTTDRWGVASFLLILATLAGLVGMAARGLGWKPGAAVLVLQFLSLLLLTH